MKSPVNLFFDKVYVLSLSKDTEKRKTIGKALNKQNIEFEFFEAIDGNSSRFDREWEVYFSTPLMDKTEFIKGRKHIQSRGAWGCLYSHSSLIRKVLSEQIERVLILEDDCILALSFREQFDRFTQLLPNDWKLLLLGASQQQWNDEDISGENFYYPTMVDTKGTFAMGYHRSVLREILVEAETKRSAFDNLPVGKVYKKHWSKCFVAYPNMIIADVSSSSIRDSKNLEEHALKMKWPLENFKRE